MADVDAITVAEPLVSEEKNFNITCDICSEETGTSHDNCAPELPYKLPCSHVFGSTCILRWLQISPRQDCPNCRRRMVHRECGHLIMPHHVAYAPPTIPDSETPGKCLRCRGKGVVAETLKMEYERLLAQERALRGMRLQLPRFFGGKMPALLGNVDERIDELRKGYAVFHNRAWMDFEESERRIRW